MLFNLLLSTPHTVRICTNQHITVNPICICESTHKTAFQLGICIKFICGIHMTCDASGELLCHIKHTGHMTSYAIWPKQQKSSNNNFTMLKCRISWDEFTYYIIWESQFEKMYTYLSMVIKKGYQFVHQKGWLVCPSKRATCFVPQKGWPVCPPKRATCLSTHDLFSPQKEKGKLLAFSCHVC